MNALRSARTRTDATGRKGRKFRNPPIFSKTRWSWVSGLPASPVDGVGAGATLIDNLQVFLLELGRFACRPPARITLDSDHFYIDLVFYHTILKCYVLIDLKVGKLTHNDLGQIQLYVNYFDKERRAPTTILPWG